MDYRRLVKALPWALLALFAVRNLLAMRADGTTADEPYHLSYGERALAGASFFREADLMNSKMPVSALNALPVALASRFQHLDWSRRLWLARLPTLVLGVLLGLLVWRWASALFGVWSGALALLLYTFCPNVLAHSHLVTTDVATSLGMFAAIYAFWRYLSAPSRGRLLLAAAAFGVAQLTKATALFLFPIVAMILGLRLGREALNKRRSRRVDDKSVPRLLARSLARDVAILALFGIGALVALNIGFWWEGSGTPLKGFRFVSKGLQELAAVPVLRDIPLPLPYPYLQGIDMVSQDATAEGWTYLNGEYSQTGFRSYFLWALLVKVPVPTLLLFALAFSLWAFRRVRAEGADDFLIVPVAFLSVYLSFFFRLDIGFRYFLPALPFLFVFTARCAAPGAWSFARVAAPWKAAATGAILLWLSASSWWVHPHYLAYFNELAGGPANGWRWLIDSNLDWGQDGEYVRNVYAPRSPVRLLFDPSGPIAGRIALGVTSLTGRDPGAARRHSWLRSNFRPISTIGYSQKIFDVTETDLARCCANMPLALAVEHLDADLALTGEAFGDGEGVTVRMLERLNDGMIGANEPVDAARTVPPKLRPVHARFGIRWSKPQTVGRIVAFPGYERSGPEATRFLALDYVCQFWDGMLWKDIPGTRVVDNQELRVEHRFLPVRATAIQLVIERERNNGGFDAPTGGFRAACLELAVYER
jgi:Dolichyl-phosphate-mannose-protein mannosyltransferase